MVNSVEEQITHKQCKIMFILSKKMDQSKGKLNKFIANDIYKYIDWFLFDFYDDINYLLHLK